MSVAAINAGAPAFNPNRILADSALRSSPPLDVQAFLEGISSPLAGLEVPDENGRPTRVSALLERVADETPLDVRVLLTRLQMEQSLLTRPPTPERLDWAMGFGVTDQRRWEAYRGFARQLEQSARTLVGYLDSRHPFSVAGLVGQPMNVSDGVVVPENLASAAGYRYTPWIGTRPAGGTTPPFGNYLFHLVWLELFGFPPSQASPEPLAGWRLIAPPDNWRHPLSVSPESLEVARELARRLKLITHEDAARKKLYLGVPAHKLDSAPKSRRKLVYPSGLELPVIDEKKLGSEAAEYRPAHPKVAAPLVAIDPDARLSPHFTMGEFLPRDARYRYVRLAPKLVGLLEELRLELGGSPLVVTSGYRPPAYNRMVGGATLSVHMDGLAADVSSYQVSIAHLYDVADRLVGNRGGVGYYPAQLFVHVDLRGERSRWTS
ncbi:MAG: DUF882 domain-containing protein [Armatimonadetes bacterium]|nr:DUF882 domain-containing protein [Armatimonadota bacterium]